MSWRASIREQVKKLILAFFAAVFLVFAFPKYDMSIFAWVGLSPLLVANHGNGPGKAFVLFLICGMIFFMGIFHWILEISGYTYLHHTLLALYLGSYFGIFGLTLSLIGGGGGIGVSLFSAPFVWVSLEYLRSNMFFLALPWGLLSHSQHNNPVIIQIASLTGAYGISFLIVMVNAAIAGVVLLFFPQESVGKG